MATIDVAALDRMIAGSKKRVEIWEGMGNVPAATGGKAYHKGMLKALLAVKDIVDG
jgi:hypothetical protein